MRACIRWGPLSPSSRAPRALRVVALPAPVPLPAPVTPPAPVPALAGPPEVFLEDHDPVMFPLLDPLWYLVEGPPNIRAPRTGWIRRLDGRIMLPSHVWRGGIRRPTWLLWGDTRPRANIPLWSTALPPPPPRPNRRRRRSNGEPPGPPDEPPVPDEPPGPDEPPARLLDGTSFLSFAIRYRMICPTLRSDIK